MRRDKHLTRSSKNLNKKSSKGIQKKKVGTVNNRSLQKIQPQSSKGKRKRTNPIKIAGGILGILLIFYLIFIFEFPANYPKKAVVDEIKVSSLSISLKMTTSTYKEKLIPLDYLLAVGGGEITTVGEKEKTLSFADGTQVVLKEGSRKVKINGKNVKLKAPVMTLEDNFILISGDIIERLFPDEGTFKDGVATFNLIGTEAKGEYAEFTGGEGYLRLVNKDNKLTAAYAPTDLIDVNSLNSIPAYGDNTKLRKQAAEALAAMYNGSGVTNLIMSSGFRNYEEQTALFKEETNSNIAGGMSQADAEAKAGTVVAVPGTSEHQLGLAVDFSIPEVVLTEDFKNTTAGKWLADNSYKYGYILRYTQEQSATTGIVYEPWHFRYIGYPHSEIVYKEKLAFDTYIENLRKDTIKQYTTNEGVNYAIWLLSDKLIPTKLEFIEGNGVGVSTDNMDNIILTLPKSKN